MDSTSEDFWRRFSGTISSDLTYFKGNQATEYNLSSETEYLRERWSGEMGFNSNLASSNGDTVSTRNQRTNYNQSVFPQPRQYVSSAMVDVELKLFRFTKTNLRIVTDIFPAISDPGRVYVATNASYFVKLYGKLSWNSCSRPASQKIARNLCRQIRNGHAAGIDLNSIQDQTAGSRTSHRRPFVFFGDFAERKRDSTQPQNLWLFIHPARPRAIVSLQAMH
jgi:hypothetical protein